MASPQIENGFLRISNEIVEALMRVNLSGAEWQIIMAIFRKTYGFQKKTDWIALSQFAKMTGMDRRNVHRAIKKLSSKQMTVIQTDDSNNVRYGFNKNYEQWKAEKKIKKIRSVVQIDDSKRVTTGNHKENNNSRVSSKQMTLSSKQMTEVSSKQTPTKESITKEKNIVIPYKKIIDLYHDNLPKLPKVAKLTKTRKGQLKARWMESEKTQSLDWWEIFFKSVSERPFLMGDNDRGWTADLEWLTKEANFVKVIEGKFMRGNFERA